MITSVSLRPAKSVGLLARDAVIDMISRLELKPGDKLPSEAELTQAFDISRPMLREALRLLEQEGLVRTEHGRGRFLSAAGSLHVTRPITAYERELGYQPETTVLSVRECRAAEYEAAALALGCEPDAQLVIMERLRSQNADPLVYSIETVPREFLPPDLTPDALGGSLNELLASQQRRPRMSSASVSAVKLPKESRLFMPEITTEGTSSPSTSLAARFSVLNPYRRRR
jgi:GntR family transcriptional regulator